LGYTRRATLFFFLGQILMGKSSRSWTHYDTVIKPSYMHLGILPHPFQSFQL
jgi:hypothetical protein